MSTDAPSVDDIPLRLAAAGLLPPDPAAAAPAIARALELGLTGLSWHLPALASLSPVALAALKSQMEDAGLALAQLLPPPYPSLVDPDPSCRAAGLDVLARCGELTARLGADNLYVRPGSLNPAGPWLPHPKNHHPETRDRLRDSLAVAARRAEALGIILAVEGHVLSPLDTPENARRLLDDVASPALRFNLDVVNFIGSVDDAYDAAHLLERLFSLLGPALQASHLKDIVVEERLVLHLAETLLGRGLLDLPALLYGFRTIRPDGWLIVEHLAPADLPEALAAVRAAAGH